MPKDFANSSRTSRNGNNKSGRKPAKPRQPTKKRNTTTSSGRTFFHGPSFTFGVILGAVIVTLVSYAPELLETTNSQSTAQNGKVGASESTPNVVFTFDKRLRDSEVKPDPKPYAPPKQLDIAEPTQFDIQAASFKRQDDAEKLRATLLLENLPARTLSTEIDGKLWYRVVVGPFERRVEADRALTKLRSRDLPAYLVTL